MTAGGRDSCRQPRCELCGSVIARQPYRRAGDQLKFCSLACNGRARRSVDQDAIRQIVAARVLQIEWTAIASPHFSYWRVA